MYYLFILLITLFVSAVVSIPIYLIVKRKIAALIMSAFLISILFFLGCLGADYNEKAIQGLDGGYTALSKTHLPSFLTFYLLAAISLIVLWLKGRRLPPLLFIVLMSLLMIGVAINLTVLVQICWNKEVDEVTWRFMFMPLIFITMALIVLIEVLRAEAAEAVDRQYKNPTLNRLNKLMAKTAMQPIWALALMLPVYVLITLVLVLLGQSPDAMVKVFTETSTWLLSQKAHPPYLDDASGHYLCTVAACGDPKIVKPLIIGKRHGNIIIVNRQLQVANAFEEFVQRSMPGLHRIIRKTYDNYGYPLSAKINTPRRSTVIYFLMKPLEYFFVGILYLFCVEPERMIRKQYRADN